MMLIIKLIKELFMKNNKQSNFLSIFGILILSLGIAIACSTTGEDNGEIATEIEILEAIILDEFKENFVGTYTAEATATLNYHGKSLIFNNNGLVNTSTSAGSPLYIDIMINGAAGAATITRIFFTEGNVDYEPYTQTVTAVNSTNVLIQNPVMYATGDTIEGGDIIELIINPDTGALTFGGVKIATKN